MASRNRLKQTSLNYFFKANSNLPSSSPIRETPVTVSTPVDTIINNIADGDEEEEGQTIPRPRKRNRIIRVEEEEGDDNNNDETTQQTLKPPTLTEDEDEDDIPPTSSPYKRRLLQRKKVMIIDDDDDDSENALDDTTVPDKNKHTQHNEINGQEEDEDDEDEDNIQDDLDFLGDNDVYQERTRGRKKSHYALALEKLKNRKQRSFDGSVGPMDRYRADYGSNNNSNSSSISEEEGEEEEEDASSAEEDDFVVDDDIIDGVKMDSPNEKVSLPAAFSTVNTQRFSTNFKIYVEFLLHTILEKDTQSLYFQQAISMVERRVRGLKDSLITSDAWRPTFKMALDRYPLWHSAVCKGLICEGCRQNRAASFEVVLAAEPEDTDAEPREEPFSLGSECYKRAKVYHKLVHFRSHLHKHVRNEAEAFMSSHDNEDDEQLTCLTEDNIMKDMHSSGFIKLLYQQTQSLFSQARFQYMPSSTRKRRSREQPLFNDDDQESYSEEEV